MGVATYHHHIPIYTTYNIWVFSCWCSRGYHPRPGLGCQSNHGQSVVQQVDRGCSTGFSPMVQAKMSLASRLGIVMQQKEHSICCDKDCEDSILVATNSQAKTWKCGPLRTSSYWYRTSNSDFRHLLIVFCFCVPEPVEPHTDKIMDSSVKIWSETSDVATYVQPLEDRLADAWSEESLEFIKRFKSSFRWGLWMI